jgi:hypothetical protein
MNKSIDTIVKQNPPKQEDTTLLSAEEIIFSRLLAKGMTPTTAYRKAFPLQANYAYDTIWRKARELSNKVDIQTEVASSRETTARLARLAEDRLEQILETDDSQRKGSKVADVAMFMYDHANGKATVRTEVKGLHVNVTYNLGGDNAPPIPQEVLDQLA